MKPPGFLHLLQMLLSLLVTLPCQAEPTVAATADQKDDSYVLKIDDSLELVVFEEDELTTKTKVLKSGEAVFPLVGSVTLAGSSLDVATRKIRDLYAAKYLVNPRVSLTVASYGEQSVAMLGALKSPGNLALPSNGTLDLCSALALAGGLSADADSSSITLIRANGSSTRYSKSQIDSSGAAVKLAHTDRVVVGQSRFIGKTVTILGKVVKPGQIDFPLDGELDLVGAISRAGGFHPLANPRKVTVNRSGQISVIDVEDLTKRGSGPFKLQPSDVISIPERVF
jgi:polysaccharide biosynthesis/export protein